MNKLKVKLLHKDAVIPNRANPKDSGADLYAIEDMTIPPNSTVLVPTGIAVYLEEGYEAQVRPKSGISAKTPKRVVLGTVDTIYHQEVKVIVDNISDKHQFIEKGKKIAQLVVAPVAYPEIEVVETFENKSTRGGFGSTGLD